MSEDSLLPCMHEGAAGYVSPIISMLSLQTIVLISLNRCGMVGVGLGALRKGENEFGYKKEYF